ncbi:hypothetical protein LguiA_024329 [Lonicera macranthoides]
MEGRSNRIRFHILSLFISIFVTITSITSDARRLLQMVESNGQEFRTMDMDESYGLSSPFSGAPMESSLPPLPLHDQNTPPFCVYPPFMLHPPSTTTTPPSTTTPLPPPSTTMPAPLFHLPPTFPTQSPPPRTTTTSPPGHLPSPPLVCQPPVVHPPPSTAPTPHKRAPEYAVWCVAKAQVPNPIIQEALDYACGSGADCESIQLNRSCYLPDTLIAHASFAFNSYWQKTKVAGGTCDFGGTAMLVTVDPSYNGCHFIYD